MNNINYICPTSAFTLYVVFLESAIHLVIGERLKRAALKPEAAENGSPSGLRGGWSKSVEQRPDVSTDYIALF